MIPTPEQALGLLKQYNEDYHEGTAEAPTENRE